MSAEIRHIVFDIGKVLIHYDPTIPFSRLIPDDEERACSSRMSAPMTGTSNRIAADMAGGRGLLLEQFPDRELHIRAFRKHWAEMVPYAYQGSVDIMTGLIDAGRDVTMLTNFASDTFREAR